MHGGICALFIKRSIFPSSSTQQQLPSSPSRDEPVLYVLRLSKAATKCGRGEFLVLISRPQTKRTQSGESVLSNLPQAAYEDPKVLHRSWCPPHYGGSEEITFTAVFLVISASHSQLHLLRSSEGNVLVFVSQHRHVGDMDMP